VSANLIALGTTLQVLEPHSTARIERLARLALGICREQGDAPHEIEALRLLGDAARDRLDHESATGHLDAGLQKATAESLPFARISMLLSTGWLRYQTGVLGRADALVVREPFEKALELATATRNWRRIADAWSGLGMCHLFAGNDELAEEAVAALERAAGDRMPLHNRLRRMLLEACLLHRRGERARAAAAFRAIAEASEEGGRWPRLVDAHVGLGASLWHDGSRAEAEAAWRATETFLPRCSLARRALANWAIDRCRTEARATPV
jgi:tetratricopeptide (TPR) repeat protein